MSLFRFEHGIIQSSIHQLLPHRFFRLDIVSLFFVLHSEQGRLGNVNFSRFDQLIHLSIKEAQQQCSNVRSIDVGIRHDDDFVVASFG